MPVESIATPGSGHLNSPVRLAKASRRALVALSWVKMHSYDLEITNKRALGPLQIPDAMIYVHLHILRAGFRRKMGRAQVSPWCAHVIFSPSDVGYLTRGWVGVCDGIALDG